MITTTTTTNNNNNNNNNTNNTTQPPSSILQYHLQQAHAIAFDVDSTLITEEGINILAEFCGQTEAIQQLTNEAMNGQILYHDALNARLTLMKPSQSIIEECIQKHPPILTKGVLEVFECLRKLNKEMYLVSGGFRELIAPIAKVLQINDTHIYANRLLFTKDGTYNGYDTTEPTSRAGGKAKALETIIQSIQDMKESSAIIEEDENQTRAKVIMVGDGATDLEARPPAIAFIGYGGVSIREIVRKEADWFITEWQPLIELLNSLITSKSCS
jgi:phosphoserine phosphatase